MMRVSGRRVTWWVLVVVFGVATLAVAALGGWEMQLKSRQLAPVADQAADRQAVTEAASAAILRLLTYTPETVEKDTAAAEVLLTGDFLAYFTNFATQTVIPTAKQRKITSKVTTLRAAVETLTSQKASLLVFVNQVTASQDKPSPETLANSVNVGIAKVNGRWLVDAFNPV